MALRASLVIATRNRAVQLRSGLQSIRDRAYGGLEIILVDDGSTDGTDRVIEEFADLFADVIHLPSRTTGYSMNPSGVLNAGHRAAHAEIHLEQGGEVCHLTDCVTPLVQECQPGRVAIARCYHGSPDEMRLMARDGLLGAAHIERPETCRTEAGRWLAPKVSPHGIHLYTGLERQAPFLFLGAIHRQDFDAVGGYDEARADRNDTDLADRLQARGVKFSFVGAAVAFHLRHDKS